MMQCIYADVKQMVAVKAADDLERLLLQPGDEQ